MVKHLLLFNNLMPYKSSASKIETTNWLLCVLCQEVTKKKLSRPNGRQIQSGYVILAKMLQQLNDMGVMPLNIHIDRINDGSGIQQTLEKNNAGYHRLCKLKITTVFSRKENTPKRKREDDSTECVSPVKTRQTLSPTPTKTKNCFFCEESSDKDIFHYASTRDINDSVKEKATDLRDTKLLTKLATKDMVAADAIYHRNCYVDLRNRWRSHITKTKKKNLENKVSIDALVLAELVAYIEESRNDTNNAIVFKLSDLTKKYVNRVAELKQVDVSTIYVRATTLRERLEERIPELWVEKQGKEVLLILYENIGPTIQYALNSDMDKDAVKLANAAQVIRKEMFESSFKFSGSFEEGCELNSVPQSLIALVHMILEGSSFVDKESNFPKARTHISVAIAQLLLFNSVKNPQIKTKAYIRHRQNREAPLPIYLGMLLYAKTRK